MQAMNTLSIGCIALMIVGITGCALMYISAAFLPNRHILCFPILDSNGGTMIDCVLSCFLECSVYALFELLT